MSSIRTLHIATVHWRSDWWIEPQLASIRAHAPNAVTWASLDHLENGTPGLFDHEMNLEGELGTQGDEGHGIKLNELARRISKVAQPEDLVLFLDGDALLLCDPFTVAAAEEPLVAVRRDENVGDNFPHPSYCLTTVGFWNQIGGDWRTGEEITLPSGRTVWDTGTRLVRQLAEAGAPWRPLTRQNDHGLHPVWFGIYGDEELGPVAYHHGAGFRQKISRHDMDSVTRRKAVAAKRDDWLENYAAYQERLDEAVLAQIATDPLGFWRTPISGPPVARRRLILHAGMHKTGTTTLQVNFLNHQEELREADIAYPRVGRPTEGHHNLAWELVGDERFKPEHGTLADLVQELHGTTQSTILLSSEDFECLHAMPEALNRLRQVLDEAGFDVDVVFSIRDAESYANALYEPLVVRGMTEEREEFVKRAVADRRVVWGAQDFDLDGADLVAKFSAVFGEDSVTWYSYDTSNCVRNFSAHLSDHFGVNLPPLDESVRANASSDRLRFVVKQRMDEAARHAEIQAALSLNLDQTREALQLAQRELDEANRYAVSLEQELSAIKASSSWRITSPLRALSRVVRRRN